ncbi:hypothetical protein, partial [Leadbetterella sp. DM7]|uniref:hypothetical protein n=1 Tax=Leadbetterella sp. DM7 TaxID=3235085 RepID=UPI00349E7456
HQTVGINKHIDLSRGRILTKEARQIMIDAPCLPHMMEKFRYAKRVQQVRASPASFPPNRAQPALGHLEAGNKRCHDICCL